MLIARATAQVSFQAVPDLVARRIRIAIDDLGGRHDHSRRAVTALQAVLLPESLLHRMEFPISGKPFNRGDIGAVSLDGKHCAGLHGLAVDEDRAGSADRSLTTDVRAG